MSVYRLIGARWMMGWDWAGHCRGIGGCRSRVATGTQTAFWARFRCERPRHLVGIFGTVRMVRLPGLIAATTAVHGLKNPRVAVTNGQRRARCRWCGLGGRRSWSSAACWDAPPPGCLTGFRAMPFANLRVWSSVCASPVRRLVHVGILPHIAFVGDWGGRWIVDVGSENAPLQSFVPEAL